METSPVEAAGPKSPIFRLSVMMFLEFFIWGAWLPLIYGFMTDGLKFDDTQKSWIMNAFAIGSVTAMFFSTQFADRNFAAERFLAFSHLVGGLSMLGLAYVTDYWPFFGLMLIHCLFYVPTISITNSIAFANMKSGADFGIVRLWGTIGWIAASVPFLFLLADWAQVPPFDKAGPVEWIKAVLANGLPVGEALTKAKSSMFLVAGIASLVLAAFSLVLPHTPPKPKAEGSDSIAWLEAAKLLRYPFIFVLFVVTFIDATVHNGYFLFAGSYLETTGIPGNWISTAMSVGQIAEILTMAVLAWVLKGLGWKWTLILGVLGHVIRFGLFALTKDPAIAIALNLLHGICYAFFFATVYIFVDDFFPKDARSSAQGLFNVLILGVGPFVANMVWPMLAGMSKTPEGGTDFSKFFLYPSGLAALGAVLLLVGFWPPKGDVPGDGKAVLPH